MGGTADRPGRPTRPPARPPDACRPTPDRRWATTGSTSPSPASSASPTPGRRSSWPGIHWVYGSVAALLATLGGLLPDLDSDSGVELKGFTGILGVLAAVAVWQRVGRVEPALAFEFHLWAVVARLRPRPPRAAADRSRG